MIESQIFFGLVTLVLILITAFKRKASKNMNAEMLQLNIQPDDMTKILATSKGILIVGFVFIISCVLFGAYCAYLLLLSLGLSSGVVIAFCALTALYSGFIIVINFSSDIVIKATKKKKHITFGVSQ